MQEDVRGRTVNVAWTALFVTGLLVGTALLWIALSPLLGRSSSLQGPQDPLGLSSKEVLGATSKLVVRSPVSLVSNGSTALLPAGTVQTVSLPPQVPESATGVLLLVSVEETRKEGAIRVSGWGRAKTHPDARPVLQSDGAGGATTQMVTLPLNRGDRTMRVTVESGGRLSLQLVGIFEPVTLSSQGRVVAVPSQRLAHLLAEGGDAETPASRVLRPQRHPVMPQSTASAVVLQVSARSGQEGALVAVGSPGGEDRQVLRWSRPGRGTGRLCQATVVVRLPVNGELPVELLSGQEADVDLVGYVTGESAAWSAAGLVLLSDAGLATGEVGPDEPGTIDMSGVLMPTGAVAQGALIAVSAAGAGTGEMTVFASDTAQPASPVAEITPGTQWGGTTMLPLAGPRVWVSGDRYAEVSLDVLWILVRASGRS